MGLTRDFASLPHDRFALIEKESSLGSDPSATMMPGSLSTRKRNNRSGEYG